MGLDDFIEDAQKDNEDSICPLCEKEGEHFSGREWLCTTNDCDAVSWFNNNYELDIDVPEIW